MQVRVLVANVPRVTLVGVREQVKPFTGLMTVVRVTGPEYPSKLTTSRVTLPDEPEARMTPFVAATISRSLTV